MAETSPKALLLRYRMWTSISGLVRRQRQRFQRPEMLGSFFIDRL